MKSLIMIFGLVVSFVCQAQWELIDEVSNPNLVPYSFFQGETILVTKNGTILATASSSLAGGSGPALIRRSIDGGQLWNTIYQDNSEYPKIENLTEDKFGNIYAWGTRQIGSAKVFGWFVLHSGDNGISWSEIDSFQCPDPIPVVALKSFFLDSKTQKLTATGLCGDNLVFRSSTDQGAHWNDEIIKINSNFASDLQVNPAGDFFMTNDQAQIFKLETIKGTKSWVMIDDFSAKEYYQKFYIDSKGQFVVLGSFKDPDLNAIGYNFVKTSPDQGLSWDKKLIPESLDQTGMGLMPTTFKLGKQGQWYVEISALNANEDYSKIREQSYFITSYDDGSTWHKELINATETGGYFIRQMGDLVEDNHGHTYLTACGYTDAEHDLSQCAHWLTYRKK